MGVANAFAGGLFVSIALMHIMPEQTESYADLYPDSEIPLPYLLLLGGYSLILVIDKILFNEPITI